jgi:glycosidase
MRLSPEHLYAHLESELADGVSRDPAGWSTFLARLQNHLPELFDQYLEIYGKRDDCLSHLEDLLTSIGRAWIARADDLKELDKNRESDPLWFQSNKMLGGVCYVDRFAGDLEGIRAKIPYFRELGLSYLHLMPLYKAPQAANDGGYAVSSYREINPRLGTLRELGSLARDLRKAGVSLALDLIINHTSDEHLWAQRARLGDQFFQDFYHLYPDRSTPDQYEPHLREIFPDKHAGLFTYRADINKWVWTTFHAYQWDLNYANPAVFTRMVEELLFLANQGAEVIRLDAVAFIWKEKGTPCENLEGAHRLIRAFNLAARIASPALLLKSEAIVHPAEVAKYVSPAECQLSYNPMLMALLWNSLATRKVRLLSQALAARYQLPPGTAWVNYVRVHDDIGWGFSDEDAALVGINAGDHRRFLNDFYTGRFEGTFARGLPFQENPKTGDCRISGTCASLAGLEKALREEDPWEVELAIRRILLLHGVIMTAGGIPLIYLGNEIGTLNDYSYRNDPLHAHDTRWVHRPHADWDKYARRLTPDTVEGRIFGGFRRLIEFRKRHAFLAGGELKVIATGNEHVLGYIRSHADREGIVLANFSETPQTISGLALEEHAMSSRRQLFGNSLFTPHRDFTMDPFDLTIVASD